MGIFYSNLQDYSGGGRNDVEKKIDDCLRKVDLLKENQKKIGEMDKEQSRLISDIYKIKDELTKDLKQESGGPDMRRLIEKREKLCKEIEDLTRERFDLMKEIDDLTRKRSDLTNIVQNLERDHERRRVAHQQAQSVPVIVYSAAMNSTLADLVSDELDSILSNQIEATKNQRVSIQRVTDPHRLPEDKPIIVICINASRIGTDVQQALQNITYSKNVTVVIIHHKEIHALPAQSSDKLLIGAEYKKLHAIIDIAYIRNKGMYTCDMNNRSLDKLIEFICDFSQSRPSCT